MTTTQPKPKPQTLTLTHLCNYCGTPRPTAELEDNGLGFVFCADATACLERLQQQGQAMITAIDLELYALNITRSQLIHQQGQIRHEYHLPDPVKVRHEAEMTKIEAEMKVGDEQC